MSGQEHSFPWVPSAHRCRLTHPFPGRVPGVESSGQEGTRATPQQVLSGPISHL